MGHPMNEHKVFDASARAQFHKLMKFVHSKIHIRRKEKNIDVPI